MHLKKLSLEGAIEISDNWILLHSSSHITLRRIFQHKCLEMRMYLSS